MTGPSPAEAAHWVATWTAAPQRTEPDDGPALPNATLRQTVRLSIGGPRVRLRLSNAFGRVPVPITAARVARPAGGRAGVRAILPGTAVPVSFGGRGSVTVPAGGQVVSDPLPLAPAGRSNLTVTLHLPRGLTGGTSHPGSRTTSYLLAGDHVDATDLPGAARTDRWFLLAGLDVWAPLSTRALVVLGDSLTDGRGSTTNGNDRWPDNLVDRLRSRRETDGVAVANAATGGNRVLHDEVGPSAVSRFDRDVLDQSGVGWLILFEGVNDLGTAAATAAAQEEVTDRLLAAYEHLVARARAAGVRAYGATLTPFGGNADYDDAAGLREAARRTVNTWIRDSRRFDAVIDFDRAVRDPVHPRRLRKNFDLGDHLHLNPAGYRALADAVPWSLFARSAPGPGADTGDGAAGRLTGPGR